MELKQNRKIIICYNQYSKFQIHKRPFKYTYKTGNKVQSDWWLKCDDISFDFNYTSKMWVESDDTNWSETVNVVHIKSLRGVVRHLRKQYLPKGLTFSVFGKYVGEVYTIKIK